MVTDNISVKMGHEIMNGNYFSGVSKGYEELWTVQYVRVNVKILFLQLQLYGTWIQININEQ